MPSSSGNGREDSADGTATADGGSGSSSGTEQTRRAAGSGAGTSGGGKGMAPVRPGEDLARHAHALSQPLLCCLHLRPAKQTLHWLLVQ